MVSTRFNTSEFTRVRIDLLSLFLTTRFKMLNGLLMDPNSLSFLDNNLQLARCMMPMVIHNLSLERNSETQSKFVHLDKFS